MKSINIYSRSSTQPEIKHNLSKDMLKSQLTYWKQQLSGTLPTLPLLTDYPKTAVQNDQDAHHSLVLSSRLTEALKALSQQQDVTLFMTLLAAFKMMLYRQTCIDDIIVGTPIALRNRVETEEGIDLFFNKLVLRTDLSGNPSFRELLQRIRKVTLDAYAHQEVPFEKVLEELQSERSQHPKFDVLFNFINTSATDLEVTEFSLNTFEKSSESQFLMMLNVEEQDGVLNLQLAYQAALFSKPRILVFLSQYQYLLEQIVVAIDTPISDYSLVTPDSQLLLPNPSMVLSQPTYETVTSLILSWAERNPALPAVSQDHDTWNYRELTNCAQAIAQVLLSQGIKSGEVVAVCGSRRFGLITSMIGAWLSGGVLLTLDENLPSQRQQLMLKEAQAKYLLHLGEKPHEEYEIGEFITYLRIDPDTGYPADSVPGTRPLPKISSEDAAYIFFTSGTTGIPKGILGWHNGLSHFLNWQRQTFEVGPSDRCAQLTGLSFDVVLRDIFLALTSGATLCLPDAGFDLSPEHILPWLEREQISIIHTVPSLAQSWLVNVPAGVTLSTLRRIFMAGEPLKDKLVRQWREAFPEAGDIINLYGPTETTLAKCYYRVPAEILPGVQPVGSPLPHCQALVFTENQQLCGIGEPGEIVLRTPFRSLGYINASDKDQQRFVKNPFGTYEDDLLYYTGDRGRYRPDGSLEIWGRIDNQVKIRGIRIELEEIEMTLNQHEVVQEAVVILHNKEDNPCLVAYLTLITNQVNNKVSEQSLLITELRNWLKTRLPEYMVPASVTVLDKMPLTPNGKINRKALPAPDLSIQVEQQAPQTEIEQLLCNLWSQVLGIEVTSTQTHFFAAGGHSLSATQLASRIRSHFKVEMPLRLIFEQPLLIDQAKWLDKQQRGSELPSISPLASGEPLPLSFAQLRLWFLTQLEGPSATYNMPAAFRLEGTLNQEALERSLQTLVQRHETLRTTFNTVNGEPVQVIHPFSENYVKLSVISLQALPLDQQTIEVQKLANFEAQRSFDFSTEALHRTVLLQLNPTVNVLLLNMHHIISDGWSIEIWVRELSSLYEAFTQRNTSSLPSLPIQYVDFVNWQRQWLTGERLEKQVHYWKQQLAGVPSLLQLPTDHLRPSVQRFQGATVPFVLSPALTHSLNTLSQQTGMTLFMTLFAAFACLLSRYSGQTDIIIGSPIANRIHSQTESLIGFFVNTLVLRLDLSGDPSFFEVLQQARRVALEAYSHQDIPFEQLVEELKPDRNLSYSPLFQVALALQNAPMEQIALSNLTVTPWMPETKVAKFDLTLYMDKSKLGMKCTLEYNTDLFECATIERMSTHFKTLLAGIVSQPQQPVSELSLLTEAEYQQIMVWNDTITHYPQRESCLHQLFEAQVERTPNAIAVVFENQQLSYAVLNQTANQLAHYLQTLGVKSEELVGICLERSLDMVIGLFGILKAGGAYLPLEPTYPATRLAFMLEDAKVPVLLTHSNLKTKLPETVAQVVCLDTEQENLSQLNNENLSGGVAPTNLAYVIYTSGSTGKPKGAMNTHLGIVNRLLWMQDAYQLNETDNVLQKTPFSFDVSVWEFFWPLLVGARLVVAKPGGHQDSAYLLEIITTQKITTLHFVPSMLQVFVGVQGLESCASLKRVICSGEALPFELQERFFACMTRTELHNLYGPTEAAIDVTYWHCQRKHALKKVPIGHPIANIQIYILDQNLNLTPIGIPGELCIGGIGLARGYLNRPALTADKFIKNPLSDDPKARLYKTGDLARYLPDGNIEYLGRIDNQVKVRGFRIELDEIEAHLMQHLAVRESVVLIHEENEDKRLIAYLVPDQAHAFPVLQVLKLEQQGLLSDKLFYELPNAMTITHLNKNETEFIYHEIFVQREYLKHGITLKEGDCIFDVGANIGLFTLFAAQECQNVTVYAFEPIPPVFESLKLNTDIHDVNAKLFNCGLSSEMSSDTFTYYPHVSLISGRFADMVSEREVVKSFILKQQKTETNAARLSDENINELLTERLESKQFTCSLTTLSEVIAENDVQKIDLLKIDVEKSELEVLYGLNDSDWLKVRQIVVEVHNIDARLETVSKLLEDKGYQLTIAQETLLEQAEIYSIYAIRSHKSPSQNCEMSGCVEKVKTWHGINQLIKDVRGFVKDNLPDYMVPSAFVMLTELPLTPNGKQDRKALPPPEKLAAIHETSYVPPQSEIEQKIATIWQNVLHTDQIGVHDNFFNIGGHSLLTMQVQNQLADVLNQKVSIAKLFQYPTIRGLASYLENLPAYSAATLTAGYNRAQAKKEARQKHKKRHRR